MDWLNQKMPLKENLKKYRYVLLAVLLGIGMMLLPQKEQSAQIQPRETVPETADVQQELERILSLIKGAGKVAVLLTQKTGEEILYQTDEDRSGTGQSGSAQIRTVMAEDSERRETGLVRQVIPPSYQGAVIVCQGGDDPRVKLAVVEAVMRATGLPSSSICVLKMK